MKIGFITPRYPPTVIGGGEISIQLLAESLTQQDWVDEVHVYSFDGKKTEFKNGVLVRRLVSINIGIRELANLVAYKNLRAVNKEISETDILHSYNMELHPTTGYISSKYNIPSVATLNSYEYIQESELYMGRSRPASWIYRKLTLDYLDRYTLSWTEDIDTYISLSDCVKSIYNQHNFTNNPIVTIPNMIDREYPANSIPDKSGDNIRMLYVGSVREAKGVTYLIKSLNYLPDKFTLEIVGSGNELRRVRDLARKLNVISRVEFRGWVEHDKVPEIYASSDIFVHPGVWPEPFGRTLIEAMQHRLPVVATNVGAAPEIVPQEELLCSSRSAIELAEAIHRADEKSKQYGIENKQHVEETYAPQKILMQFKKLYGKISDEY